MPREFTTKRTCKVCTTNTSAEPCDSCQIDNAYRTSANIVDALERDGMNHEEAMHAFMVWCG